jgi:FkbM family methyltransferase
VPEQAPPDSRNKNWKVFNWAFGSKSGSGKLHVTRDSQLSSLLTPNEAAQDAWRQNGAVVETVDVKVARLDDVWGDFGVDEGHNVFLKLDTQGYDFEVIRGSERVLQRFSAIQTEVYARRLYENSASETETLDHLKSQGFEVSASFQFHFDRYARLVESDCVFVNPRRHPRYSD